MRSSLRILTLLLAVWLLTGCGVKTAYNNADWLVMRWVNDRVSLTSVQERELRDSIEANLAWHCASELPDYAAFLRQVDADVRAGRVDERTIESYGEQVSDFGRRLLQRVRPSLIELLASLDDKQVAELVASFEQRNLELAEEAEAYADDHSAEKRVEGMEKGIRRFSGRLTDEQRERLRSWAARLHDTTGMALEQRLKWQAEFQRVMLLRQDRERFEAAMAALLQPDLFVTEALEQQREYNRAHTIETMADIHGMAPDRQIQRLRNNLTDFSSDLEQLSCSS
ncbi:DUF6279 family lipoprotein [Wenzhouxiangella sp. EGI_FJ10305]|uniref:DUF6279 family lipoprotein n=1 Tax=Wenzhouxiangella sp. EGI_FJ10305 TaxID=3243768 RepID=UPI0035E01D4A